MFIDASALTAIIAEESDGLDFAARLDQDDVRMTSPLAVWETVTAVVRLSGATPYAASQLVFAYLADAEIEIVSIPSATTDLALDAFDRFGKGRHKAALNFGDCFAYTCAKHFRQPLMFKGSDFALTDIESA